jgi:2-(3-amino-3-carboxypropyl)histidine synthase
MKTHHLEAKATLQKVDFDTKELPKKIGIVTTIQYIGEMKKVIDHLWKHEIKAVVAGQVIGCDASAALTVSKDVDAFLYVGSGEFHPIGVALQAGKQVFVLHPESMKIRRIAEADIERIRKKKQGMLVKFHTSTNIGVLLTTKQGQGVVQGGIKKVQDIEKKYPNKKFYYFICDTLNFMEIENFPFIECWINTMCPRVVEDIKVLNLQDI